MSYQYITNIGSATAGVDYEAITTNLTFAENSVDNTMQCINVTTIDDTLVEGNEFFTAMLSFVSSGVDVMLGGVESTVTIVDDDCEYSILSCKYIDHAILA